MVQYFRLENSHRTFQAIRACLVPGQNVEVRLSAGAKIVLLGTPQIGKSTAFVLRSLVCRGRHNSMTQRRLISAVMLAVLSVPGGAAGRNPHGDGVGLVDKTVQLAQ